MSKCKHFISVRFLDEGNNNEKLTCNSVNHTVVTHVITGETEEEFVWNVVDFIEEFVQVKNNEIKELILEATHKPRYYAMLKVYNDFICNETFVNLVMQKTNMRVIVEKLLVKPWEPKEDSSHIPKKIAFVIQQNMKNRLFPLIEALQNMKVEK